MLMRAFRRLYRFPAVIFWTTYVGLRVLPSQFGNSPAKMHHCAEMTQLLMRGLALILGMRFKVLNPQNAPHDSGGFVVSNHLSYLDTIVHATLTRVRFAPKAEIRWWPVIGFIVGLSRPVWIYRKNKQKAAATLKQFKETIANGVSMLVYPEGTTTDGTYLLEFKTTPFEAPIETGAMLHPMLMKYLGKPDDPTLCWYGDMYLFPHAWMVFGRKHLDVLVEWLPPQKLDPSMNRKEVCVQIRDELGNALARYGAKKGSDETQ